MEKIEKYETIKFIKYLLYIIYIQYVLPCELQITECRRSTLITAIYFISIVSLYLNHLIHD